MTDLMIVIRRSVELGKKIYCNGVGHFAAYHYLCTRFDKYYHIAAINTKHNKPVDYEY